MTIKQTPEHISWRSMRNRCNNSSCNNYELYGGSGISYDPSWNSFEVFLADMGNKPSPEMQLDRIDANKDYSKSNCRWATPRQNANNRRNNRWLVFAGVVRTAKEWADLAGITKECLHYRLKAGWTVEDALTTPTNYGNGWKNGKRAAGTKEDN